MSEIKVGDCVQLKSGGPIMTVFGVVAAKRKLNEEYGASKFVADQPEVEIILAECCWFESSKSGLINGSSNYGNPCSRAFVIECLEVVDMTVTEDPEGDDD